MKHKIYWKKVVQLPYRYSFDHCKVLRNFLVSRSWQQLSNGVVVKLMAFGIASVGFIFTAICTSALLFRSCGVVSADV